MKIRTWPALCGLVVINSTGAATALAQTTDTADAAPKLEEVVVTAQRRTENLQKVPIAATVLAGDQLESKAVTRLEDLQYASPGLSVTGAGLTQSVNIRGIGLASGSPAVANGVATYVDGLFQPPIVTTSAFYDIAGMEVLRGPQGTLVGSNSTGGAIFINTQSPKLDALDGYAQLGYGNFNAVEAQGAVNLPLGDTFAVRLAGEDTSHESFYHSVGPQYTDAGRLGEHSGRIGMLWKPGAFQALAKIEYTDRNTGGYAYRPIPGTQYAAYAPAGDFDLAFDSPELNHERGLITSLELRYEFDNGITLRSLSGYQDKNIHNLYDTDATTEATAANPRQTEDQHVREREKTEEINLISPTGGPFNWILGGYVQRNLIDVDLAETSNDFPTTVHEPENKTTTGWFAQAGYKLTSDLELQAGARYSTYKVDAVGGVFIGGGIPGFPPGGLQVADLSGSHRDGRPTGKVALNWNVDADDLLYAFVARGYKQGGFNSSTSQFQPETVLDLEAGWKGTLLADHLRTQLGVFHNGYDGFQSSALDLTSGQVGVVNLQAATIWGFEGQLQLQLGGLQADGGFAWVDSHLGGTTLVNTRLLPAGTLGPQCAAGTPSAPPVCFDYNPYLEDTSGGPNLYSPKWTLNAGVQYEFGLGRGISLTPRLNYAYVGPQYTYLTYSLLTDYLHSSGLLSALLTLRLPHDWSVEGYGTNLTDRVYVTGQFGNNEFFGAPRQYGLRVTKVF